MNTLSSRQRKLVYSCGIVFLLIPIYFLGGPTSVDVQPGTRAEVGGGMLARMRVQYDLGESTLGEIDPSSAAMNLMLLGLRGPAATVLNLQALEYQEKKDWAKLKTTLDAVLKLQPHYVETWKFQGWNLAYNVSREWDKVADRFYWVKEGIKFTKLGTARNATAAILFHQVADICGSKIGNADEKSFFRKFFVVDPDTKRFDNGPDPETNQFGKDNYLVAKDWYAIANEKDKLFGIDGKEPVLARARPARALFDYARARQRDGVFGEENGADWDNAYREWTEVYGKEIFLGMHDIKYKLNSTEDDFVQMAEENKVTLAIQKRINQQNVAMTNFDRWVTIGQCERDPLMVKAHKKIYEGKVAYKEGRIYDDLDEDNNVVPSEAEANFMEGMVALGQVFQKYPNIAIHSEYLEEGLLALYYWSKLHQVNDKEVGPTPMGRYANENPGLQQDVAREFILENRLGITGRF